MKTETAEPVSPYWRSMRWIVEKALPRGYREEHLGALDRAQDTGPMIVLDSARTIAAVYWNHAAASFNHWAFYLQAALTIFSFGMAPVPWALAIPSAAVLVALAFRAAYTHHDVTDERQVQPLAQYYADSAVDALVAGVFMVASQMLTRLISPGMLMPVAILYRGALVCLPLMAIVRMALRPKPAPPNNSFNGPGIKAEEIYRRAWRLNILWLVTFYLLIFLNVTDKDNYLPDKIRGFLIVLFGIWHAVQRNSLSARREWITLFADVRKQKLERMINGLPKGIRKGEPRFCAYVVLESAIVLAIGMSLVEAVWPWLSGQTTAVDFANVLGSIVAFATTVLSWHCIKESNRAAAHWIHVEIAAATCLKTHSAEV